MKEQIKLLIAQHKLYKEECEIELKNLEYSNLFLKPKLRGEIEMRNVFISELEELLSY